MSERIELAEKRAKEKTEKKRERRDARMELRQFLGEVTFEDKLRRLFDEGHDFIEV